MSLLSKPVSRRYTPPTCSLEITAQPSALSRWAGHSVFKDLQFQLSFEDPRQPHEPVQVSGERPQLEALSQAVELYVQQLLNHTPPVVDTALQTTGSTPAVTESNLWESSAFTDWNNHFQANLTAPGKAPETQEIYLQPNSLLFHELFLGPLATERSGPTINLSVSSLFDLASALEASTAEVLTLPSLKPQRMAWLRNSPLWARVAAIAVAFVGVTTTTLQLTNYSVSDSQGTAPLISQTVREQAPVAPPPPPPNPAPLASLPPVVIPSTLPALRTPAGLTSPKALPKTTQPTPQPSLPVAAATPVIPTIVQPDIAIIEPQVPNDTPAPQANAPTVVPEPETSSARSTDSAADNQRQVTGAPATQVGETAFDVVPQVAEARSYFQQRWQPPQGLRQTLEYTLVLNPNGSMQRPIPLNQAARTYLDRTPIPLANESFVSPLAEKGTPKIRLVLGPDGKVQTFLESPN